jgi:hypothetical protein
VILTFMSSEINQYYRPPLPSSPQRLAETYTQSLYIKAAADKFPRSP